MAFDPASSSPKPVSQGSRLNLLKNYGPRSYRFHWKLGKMGGYETINKRYGSFILRLKILVITADLFYTDTLLSRKMQLLWPRTIFFAITSDIARNFAQNSVCGAVIVWERGNYWSLKSVLTHGKLFQPTAIRFRLLYSFYLILLGNYCLIVFMSVYELFLYIFSTKEEDDSQPNRAVVPWNCQNQKASRC